MTVRSLLGFAHAHRSALLLMAVLSLASSVVMLALPWLGARMISGIVVEKAPAGQIVMLLIAALVALAALNFTTVYISSAAAARILAELRVRILTHLQLLPVAFHNDRQHGDILALATFEVSRLGQFITGTLVALPARLLTAAGAIILMFRIDATLALLVPALVPAFYIILKLTGRRLHALARSAQQAEAAVVATVGGNLAMIPAIKSFAREEIEADKYRGQVSNAMRLSIRWQRMQGIIEPLVGLVSGSGAVFLLYLAGRDVQSGDMSPLELLSFLFYAALLTRPVGALAQVYGDFVSARGTLERLQSVMLELPELGHAQAAATTPARGEISFVRVSFAYPGRNRTLHDASLHIEAGEKIALIGDNGAGKTTLMNLLLRFSDPDQGSILLDGCDITSMNVRDLRRQIGVVPQRALLFNGSIRANIAYGLEGANDDQIWAATRLAQASDFIAALPQGLDTPIGDHGVRLSGGQRQRLSLARALVKDPPILILDEATSMFDSEGEQAFIETSVNALGRRTVILITHRPASLAIADRIISVERGSMREVSRYAAQQMAASIR